MLGDVCAKPGWDMRHEDKFSESTLSKKIQDKIRSTRHGAGSVMCIWLYLVVRRTNIKSESAILFYSIRLSFLVQGLSSPYDTVLSWLQHFFFLVHHVWNLRLLQLLEGKGVFIGAEPHIITRFLHQ